MRRRQACGWGNSGAEREDSAMRRDLALVAALAFLALIAALLSVPVGLRAPLLVPLVLFLPGYAVAANFFAPKTIGLTERGVYAIVLSIAITAVGGLVI